MIHELDLLEPTGENLRMGKEQVDRICQRSCKKEGESLINIAKDACPVPLTAWVLESWLLRYWPSLIATFKDCPL